MEVKPVITVDEDCVCPEHDDGSREDENGLCVDPTCPCGQVHPMCSVHGHWAWSA